MSWLASQVLRLIHFVYSLVLAISSLRDQNPHPLAFRRSKIPQNVALVLAYSEVFEDQDELKECLIQCVEKSVIWCRAIGIAKLIVYDRQGK